MRQKGNGLIHQGLYDRGLENHRAALAVYEEVGAQAELAEALHDTGRPLPAARRLGVRRTALHSRARPVPRQARLSRGITLNLTALGDLRVPTQELRRRRQHSTSRRSSGPPQSGEQQLQAQSLLRLAQVHREQRQLPAGGDRGGPGARHRPRDRRPPTGSRGTARSSGDCSVASGSSSEALKELHGGRGRAGLDARPRPALADSTSDGHAPRNRVATPGQRSPRSLAAVTVIESVRDQLQEPRFRAGFVDDKYEVYIELVRLQLQLGRTAEAFSTAERLRARSFAEQLGGRSPLLLSDADRRKEAQLSERIRQLQRALVGRGQRRASRHTRNGP